METIDGSESSSKGITVGTPTAALTDRRRSRPSTLTCWSKSPSCSAAKAASAGWLRSRRMPNATSRTLISGSSAAESSRELNSGDSVCVGGITRDKLRMATSRWIIFPEFHASMRAARGSTACRIISSTTSGLGASLASVPFSIISSRNGSRKSQTANTTVEPTAKMSRKRFFARQLGAEPNSRGVLPSQSHLRSDSGGFI